MSDAATVHVFPGDGIGPEVTREAVAVLEAVARRHGLRLTLTEGLMGGCAIDATGAALPPPELERARAADAVLLGAVGGPKWDDPKATVRPEQGLLALRKGLGVFANLRPVATIPALLDASAIKAEVLRGVDLVVVRELTGGIYFGQPSERRTGPHGREALDTMYYTEGEIARLMHAAFALARTRRRRLASVDKANVLSSSRLWREVAHEVHREYPDVAYEDVLVDAMAMHLIRRPRDFDVIATENLFGDILTDEASMLAGSMGLLPSASLAGAPVPGTRCRGLYEPIHGSAPDIAGQDRANPLAAILSAAMLCRYSLAAPAAAADIEAAVAATVAAGYRTADMAQSGEHAVGCRAMGAAVRERLGA
ncbi:MAG TPA: 3-isopropylmalate dehydrogenase [Candidatus Limnocylindria bacterium]|nr:3-isopropylmalate dehydrogenase [Candidatus Limnocylindria bacterium]